MTARQAYEMDPDWRTARLWENFARPNRLNQLLPSIHRLQGLHGFHRLHGFHWFHRLHLSDFLIRFFKRQFFRILQLGFAAHQLDLIIVDPNKPNAIFALNTENEVLTGPKQLRPAQSWN